MAQSNDHVKSADQKLKGKRGRRPEPEIDDFDEYAAAETLVLLANCDADGFCPRSTPRRREFIDIASLPNPQSPTAHPAADAANYGPAVNVEIQVSVFPDTPLQAAEINSGGRHVCLVCGKRFQSPQALGGHMTSHRLKPQTTTTSDDGNISSAARVHSDRALVGHKKDDEPLIARKVPATSPSISFHIDLNMPAPEESDS